ncbi:hypothetical protein A9K65_021110 [Mesorhizobium sp. WSM1497]|nr:hypothetical protein A9K65_021110 [Mesorhizobium sp. WSM1497]
MTNQLEAEAVCEVADIDQGSERHVDGSARCGLSKKVAFGCFRHAVSGPCRQLLSDPFDARLVVAGAKQGGYHQFSSGPVYPGPAPSFFRQSEEDKAFGQGFR